MIDTLILDCYTDEPSGYGVRPFLGTHQIHLSQALTYRGIEHAYITIEDLRYCRQTRDKQSFDPFSKELLHRTKNCDFADKLVANAKRIYIIMGCFVDYEYFSSIPPKSEEVYDLIKDSMAEKILFYVMASEDRISTAYEKSKLKTIIDHTEIGNTYRYVLEEGRANNFTQPNYPLLATISGCQIPIIEQLTYPVIAEIETGTGCNTPTCKFCIEAARRYRIRYREPLCNPPEKRER